MNISLRFFLYILILPGLLKIYGQQRRVLDSETSVALEGVSVRDSLGIVKATTDSRGLFDISVRGQFIFTKEGYYSLTAQLEEGSVQVLELEAIPEQLNEVVITSNIFQSKLKTLPTAISVISTAEISNNNTFNVAPLLNSVPGIYMHNGTLTTNRITIRGIGSRNLFGTSKLRAYFQEIPLTNGSGESTIEDIELQTLGRMEISKGPSSSTYGAGLGGTIQLIPEKGNFDEISAEAGTNFGSYGLQKYLLKTNLGDLNNSGTITYSNLRRDGYRDNNETWRESVVVATNHLLGEKDIMTIIANYIDLKAFIPSSLNEEDFINNPTAAAFSWDRAKGFEDYIKGLLGISWRHQYSDKSYQYTSVFGSLFDSYEPRPFNILEEETLGYGLRTHFNSQAKLFNRNLEWTLGGELFRDKKGFKTFENLYEDFPEGTGSVQGSQLTDFLERRTYINLFTDTKLIFSERAQLSFGLNFNLTSYDLDDRFTVDGADASGDYNFGGIFSPKVGFTYGLADTSMVYASVSHGFSPPSLEETLLPDGLINNDIEPETGWNYEIGGRGDFFNNSMHLALSLYHMDVRNLLVARRTAADEFIGVNAGETRYNGLELSVNYRLLKSPGFNLDHVNSFTWNDFRFRTFIDDGNDYSGNELTGAPDLTFYSRLEFNTAIGVYGWIDYNYTGEIPIRDDNAVFASAYQLVNTKVGFRSNPNKKFRLDVYTCINNVLDEKYASMLLINAGSFGGQLPRYYYPGEPINYFAGVNLSYLF